MAYKTFCDECEKEIKRGESFQIMGFGEFLGIKHYCPQCFKKHWKESKKEKSP